MTIAQTLEPRVYVVGLWEEIGKADGFDIYELLKEALNRVLEKQLDAR